MGNLYLRDLKEHLQADYVLRWKDNNREDLLRAYEDGEDIEIGEYCADGLEEVA